ncbi:flavodoxin family protein [Comamonas testosteroni]|uniref:flavodoxin family protein n=1 Tax=Comamonas testosteroni TaxID=285 RepID=UPI0015F7D581|nr:flavodoxin family protein [Comamonas testosteroni]
MKLNEDLSLHFVIIAGSERSDGNTDQITHYTSDFLADQHCSIDIIYLRDYHIKPCGACGECNIRTQPCEIADDMPSIIKRIQQADAVIYAAPVHGYGLAHPMQIFIERAGVGYLRFERPLANKVAGAVVMGRRYAHEAVYHQLINNILLNRMILVGSGYPTVIHGGAPGSGMRDVEGLASLNAHILRMIGMARLLKNTPQQLLQTYLHAETVNERAA